MSEYAALRPREVYFCGAGWRKTVKGRINPWYVACLDFLVLPECEKKTSRFSSSFIIPPSFSELISPGNLQDTRLPPRRFLTGMAKEKHSALSHNFIFYAKPYRNKNRNPFLGRGGAKLPGFRAHDLTRKTASQITTFQPFKRLGETKKVSGKLFSQKLFPLM